MKKMISSLIIAGFSLLPVFSFAEMPEMGSWNLPPGNYKNSCDFCEITHHNVLKCNCKDKRGFSRATSIYLDQRCSYIENVDGTLQCTRSHHRPHNRIKDVRTGPIWNRADAQGKCPRVCADHSARWTGNWNTIAGGSVSVCQCQFNSNWQDEREEDRGGMGSSMNTEGFGSTPPSSESEQ